MRRLFANKILLGVLCITIGIAPLLTLINIIGSGKALLSKEFNREGNRLISARLNGSAVTYNDLKKLEEIMPEIKTVIPVSRAMAQLSSYKSQSNVELKAVGYDYWKLSGLDMIKGDFISRRHVEDSQNVIVIDDITADELFGTSKVLGRSISFSLNGKEVEATIIGVCKRLDISEDKPASDQGIAFIPISVLDYNSDTYSIDEAFFMVKLHVEEAKARLNNYFVSIGADEAQLELSYITQVNFIKSLIDKNLQSFVIAGLLWFFAAIIGLINIMLADMEKSRKYYDLLKFYGNTEKQIRRLVLTNALGLGLTASVINIAVSLTASSIICSLLNLPIIISVHTLTLGILIPAIICLLASIYPANRAARIDMDNIIWQYD